MDQSGVGMKPLESGIGEELTNRVVEWCFNALLDDLALGYSFDVHRLCYTGLWEAIEGVEEDDADEHVVRDNSCFKK